MGNASSVLPSRRLDSNANKERAARVSAGGGTSTSGTSHRAGATRANHGNASSSRSKDAFKSEPIAMVLSDSESEGGADEVTSDCGRCGTKQIPEELMHRVPMCGCRMCMYCVREHVHHLLGRAPSWADKLACPSCGQENVSILDCQRLAPQAFKEWSDRATAALLNDDGSFISCPSCNVIVEAMPSTPTDDMALSGVPELDRTAPFLVTDEEGRALSRLALCHREENRFRCPACSANFCKGCMRTPYHLGTTCDEFRALEQAVKCRYCGSVLRLQTGSEDRDLQGIDQPVKVLRRELEKAGVDSSWCVEKRELISVRALVSSVCDAKACVTQLQGSCTRRLVCGHQCGGVRAERACLPCLESACRREEGVLADPSAMPTADDSCSICQVEPLRNSPAVQLECGHVVHRMCAVEQLARGYPGPAISFGFLDCPLCHQRLSHWSLCAVMRTHLELLASVQQKALRRLKMEGKARGNKELQPGGAYDGRPGAYAMTVYNFYLCSKCRDPYCGGEKRCGAGPAEEEEGGVGFDPRDLVCGGCCAGEKGSCQKGHGNEFVEFKCKFCCSVASFFCFGTTHFCDSCHHSRPDVSKCALPKCDGPKTCPLHISHPPNGTEHCLGCSMCRHLGM